MMAVAQSAGGGGRSIVVGGLDMFVSFIGE